MRFRKAVALVITMTKPKLSIIIVNWNTKILLDNCLNSILDSYQLTGISNQKISTDNQSLITDNPIEIIIVDNGSTDGSVKYLKDLKIKNYKLKIIYNSDNLGFGKANNQGIKIAQGKYIMLLNSDTIVKPGAIELLVEYLDTHPVTAVVGPKLLNVDGTPQANCGRFPSIIVSFIMLFVEKFALKDLVRYSPKATQVVDWLMGAAFMARHEVFNKIGGLDEEIFMYMEEVEWFYRVNKYGYRVDFFPGAEIVHLGRGSSKSGKKDPIINIYRGLTYFYKKHYSTTDQLILLGMLKLKALFSYTLGIITNNHYLQETYAQAFKVH